MFRNKNDIQALNVFFNNATTLFKNLFSLSSLKVKV